MNSVEFVVRDHVAVMTINRPERANAVDLASWIALGDGLERFAADVDVRAVIITGSGQRSFCAGVDLLELKDGLLPPSDPRHALRGFAGLVNNPVSVPVLAAVNGAALGGGTEIVLAADLAVASRDARFGLPEVTRGIIAGSGGAIRLVEQVPRKLAMELLLTGRGIDADRALELGLVNAVVEPDEVLDQTIELALEIAANAPLAVRATKRVAAGIVDGVAVSETERWALARRESALVRMSEDAAEGVRAFAQRRAPEWSGR